MLSDYYYLDMGLTSEDIKSEDLEATNNTIDTLKDNGFSDMEIRNILSMSPAKTALRQDDLPEEVWNGSLLTKGTYYYHKKLHTVAKPKSWDPETGKYRDNHKIFIEMKIRFTEQDIIDYFYDNFPIEFEDTKDMKRDIKSVEYLLDYCEKILKSVDITAVDFILYLIDEAFEQCRGRHIEIINLKDYCNDAKVYVTKKIIANNKNRPKIMWR